LSQRVCGLPANDADRIAQLIAACDLSTSPPKIAHDRWLELMSHDKKSTEGVIRFVLLEALGRAVLRTRMESNQLAIVLAG